MTTTDPSGGTSAVVYRLRGLATWFMLGWNLPLLLTGAIGARPPVASDDLAATVAWYLQTAVPAMFAITLFAVGIGYGVRAGRRRDGANGLTARAAAMLAVGCIHLLVVGWWGDILLAYGVALLISHRMLATWAVPRLAVVGATVAAAPVGLSLSASIAALGPVTDSVDARLQSAMNPASDAFTYGGDLARAALGDLWRAALNYQLDFLPFALPQIVGAMMVGASLSAPHSLFGPPARRARALRVCFATGIVASLMCAAYPLVIRAAPDSLAPASLLADSARFLVAPLIGMLAFATWTARPRTGWCAAHLESLGRWSLTWYLTQTVSCVAAGRVLGAWGALSHAQALALGIVWATAALVVAPLLARRGRGPAERLLAALARALQPEPGTDATALGGRSR